MTEPTTTLDTLAPDQCALLERYAFELGYMPDIPWHSTERITTGKCLLCERPLGLNITTGEASCMGVPRLHTWADLGDMLDRLPLVIPSPCYVGQHSSATCLASNLRQRWIDRVAEILDAHRLTLTTSERVERVRAHNEYAEQVFEQALDRFFDGVSADEEEEEEEEPPLPTAPEGVMEFPTTSVRILPIEEEAATALLRQPGTPGWTETTIDEIPAACGVYDPSWGALVTGQPTDEDERDEEDADRG